MKKTISATLLVVILLSLITLAGCSKGDKVSSNEYNRETDYPYMYETNNNGTYITESEDGYYYLDGHFLFYADKETMTSIPLCNKPNCKHIKETDNSKVYYCNAYLGEGSALPYIQYYENKIYTIEGFDSTNKRMSKTLVEISLDGSQRKRLTELSDGSVYGIHRGYLYECANGYNAEVLRVPMNNLKAEPEVIFESELEDSAFYFNPKGQYIYVVNFGSLKDGSGLAWQNFRYDTAKKESTRIITDSDDTMITSHLYKSDNSMLLYSTSDETLGVADPANRKIFTSDLDGSNEKLFKDYNGEADSSINDFFVKLHSDGTYYYENWINYMLDDEVQRAGKFIIYDKDFNKIHDGDKKWLPVNHWITFGGDDHIFFNYSEKGTDINTILYAKKSDLANGEFITRTLSENTYSETHPGISY